MLKYLDKNREQWEYVLDDSLLSAVERYLHTKMIPVTKKNPLVLLIKRWEYKDNFRFLCQGIHAVRTFLHTVRELLERHQQEQLPQNLRHIITLYKEIFKDEKMSQFLAKPARRNFSMFKVFKYDALFRTHFHEELSTLLDVYFYSEVKRIKAIAELVSTQERAFILLDELFKGTNIHDAYEASRRVILGFANWPNHLFMLSSHLVELASDIEAQARFCCKYFDAQVIHGTPVYSYELKDGISQTRLGLTILEKEHVFELLSSHNTSIM